MFQIIAYSVLDYIQLYRQDLLLFILVFIGSLFMINYAVGNIKRSVEYINDIKDIVNIKIMAEVVSPQMKKRALMDFFKWFGTYVLLFIFMYVLYIGYKGIDLNTDIRFIYVPCYILVAVFRYYVLPSI